jgi:hypothetical protein
MYVMRRKFSMSINGNLIALSPVCLIQLINGWGIKCYDPHNEVLVVNCDHINVFEGKPVTEIIIVRPLSYTVRDAIETRLQIETDNLGVILNMTVG